MSSKQQLTKSKTGFTIIEVVLVLAIAGLIFLMVFVALPALQRSQRDAQRRQDVSRVAAALTQYQTNNGGDLPSGGAWSASASNGSPVETFKTDYLGDLNNQNGGQYTMRGYKMTSTNQTKESGKPLGFSKLTTSDRMNIYSYASCSGETPVYSEAARDYAILLKLEGAGYYCLDNK